MDLLDFESDNDLIFSYGFLILNVISLKICYVEFLKVVLFFSLFDLLDDFFFGLENIL